MPYQSRPGYASKGNRSERTARVSPVVVVDRGVDVGEDEKNVGPCVGADAGCRATN